LVDMKIVVPLNATVSNDGIDPTPDSLFMVLPII
jgi:hypothetical protein